MEKLRFEPVSPYGWRCGEWCIARCVVRGAECFPLYRGAELAGIFASFDAARAAAEAVAAERDADAA